MNYETLIQQLALKLGVSVELLWKALHKQAFIEAYTTISIWIVYTLLLVCGFAFYLNNFLSKKDEKGNRIPPKIDLDDSSSLQFLCIVGAIVGAILTIVYPFYTVDSFIKIITCLNNPDYYSFTEILKFIR